MCTYCCWASCESTYMTGECHTVTVFLMIFPTLYQATKSGWKYSVDNVLCLFRDHLEFIFFRHLTDPRATLEAMLRPKVTHLPGHIQSVYVQNIAKLYSHIVQQAEEEEGENSQPVREVTQLMLDKLPMFVQSGDLEVQERVCMRGGSSWQRRLYPLEVLLWGCSLAQKAYAVFGFAISCNLWKNVD